MGDNLDKYLPEYDEDGARGKLAELTKQQLTDMLIHEYKLKRVIAKMLDGESNKLQRIEAIIAEPSGLTAMPDIPSAADLRKLMEEE
jgi:hypothetical protein